MRKRRTRLALALAAVGLVAVGGVFAAGGSSNRSTAPMVAARGSDGDMPVALSKHLAKLGQTIPGNGGEPAGESAGNAPGSSTASLEQFAQMAYPKKDVPLSSLKAARAAFQTARVRTPGAVPGSNQAAWEQVGPGHGAVPGHAVPHRALVRANRVRDGRANDRSGDRPELRDESLSWPGRVSAECGSLRRAAASGARRTRSRRTRSGSTWQAASGSTRLWLDHDRPERSRARTRSGHSLSAGPVLGGAIVVLTLLGLRGSPVRRAAALAAAAAGLMASLEASLLKTVTQTLSVSGIGGMLTAGPDPVHAEHAGPDRPGPQREREDRPGSGLTCRGGEGRPAVPGFRGAKVRGQNGPTGGGRIQRWSFSHGQLELGKLVADHISDLHQVSGFPVAGRRQPAAGDVNRGHGRRARIRGGHVPAPAGRLDGDQAPDPSRPAVWLPSGESGMDAWVCWARRECLRASRHHAWTSSDSGTTPVYVCCRARPLTTVPESRAPGDHSGRLTATDKATRPSFPPGSHFGVQVFEKLSGRRDLNPRPLDPQECTPISATCLTSCFPQVKPPQVSRCQHRTALLSTGGSHCVPSPAETFALPGELVRHMRNAPGRAQEGLRGLASWLWLAVVVIVGAPHAGNTRVMARIAVRSGPVSGTVAMSQMVRVGGWRSLPAAPDVLVDLVSSGLQRHYRLRAEHVDDEFADLRDMPGSGSDEALVAGLGQDGVGIGPVCGIGSPANESAPLEPAG